MTTSFIKVARRWAEDRQRCLDKVSVVGPPGIPVIIDMDVEVCWAVWPAEDSDGRVMVESSAQQIFHRRWVRDRSPTKGSTGIPRSEY